MASSFMYTPLGSALISHMTLMLNQFMLLVTLPVSLLNFIRTLMAPRKSIDSTRIMPTVTATGSNSSSMTVLVTGASAGIGAAVAIEYAKQYPGVRLILIARNQDRLLGIKNNCLDLGASEVHIHSVDVRDRLAMRKIVVDADDAYTIDVVIAQAGKLSFSDMDNNEGHNIAIQRDKTGYVCDMYETNILGELNTIEPLLERFKQRRAGKFAVMGSVAGYLSFPNQLFYGGSKVFINVFTRDLREHLVPYNVSVTLIAPGLIQSQLSEKMLKHGGSTFPHFALRDVASVARAIIQAVDNNVDEVSEPVSQWILFTALGHAIPWRLIKWVSWLTGLTSWGGTKWS